MTHAIFFLYSCTEERTRHRKWHCRFAWNRRGASSEGCEITLAKSSGWSHHKEDKTKGHSEPWIICCCHPTPSHNPSLCDSLFWSYVMNGRLWSALSILLPQYSDNANILWPELSEVCLWRTERLRSRGKGGRHFSICPCPCAKILNSTVQVLSLLGQGFRMYIMVLLNCKIFVVLVLRAPAGLLPVPGLDTRTLGGCSNSVTFTLAAATEI